MLNLRPPSAPPLLYESHKRLDSSQNTPISSAKKYQQYVNVDNLLVNGLSPQDMSEHLEDN